MLGGWWWCWKEGWRGSFDEEVAPLVLSADSIALERLPVIKRGAVSGRSQVNGVRNQLQYQSRIERKSGRNDELCCELLWMQSSSQLFSCGSFESRPTPNVMTRDFLENAQEARSIPGLCVGCSALRR